MNDIRLPRSLLALLVGGALGLSGAVLQGLTRNPLAEPGLLGVSTGAALGAVMAIYFGVTAISVVAGPVLGMIGALAACALTFGLGQGGGTITLVLAGAAVSSLTAAGIALALNFAPNPYAAYEIMNWLLGLAGRQKLDPGLAGSAFYPDRRRGAGHHRPGAGRAQPGRGAGGKPGRRSHGGFGSRPSPAPRWRWARPPR